MFWRILCYSGVFGTVWLPYETRCNIGQTIAKFLCHKVASKVFATNSPDPPHWTLNSCFGVFCTIWVHLGLFSCLTKLSAKRAELVQKFVTQSRVGIFGNERTYSTPLDPKLIFWCILYYSVYLGQLFAL